MEINSTFNRVKNLIKQTINDSKLNTVISRQELYNIYANKYQSLNLNGNYLLNVNDYEIIAKFVSKNTFISPYLQEFLEIYEDVSEQIRKANLMSLQEIYQNKYNYFSMYERIQYKHIYLPDHITKLEKELFKSIEVTKNFMLSIFASLRQILNVGAIVYFKQPYCDPQHTYRQLESIAKPNWVINEEQQVFIKSTMNTVKDHYNQILTLLDLIQEEVEVLILYYQEQDQTATNLYRTDEENLSHPVNQEYIQQRKEELSNLKDILNGYKK